MMCYCGGGRSPVDAVTQVGHTGSVEHSFELERRHTGVETVEQSFPGTQDHRTHL